MLLAAPRPASPVLPLLVAFFSLSPAAMAEDIRNVLVLYGNTAELPWVKVFDAALRSAVAARTKYRVDLYTEYFDVARFPAERHHEAFVELVRARYADQRTDVVVSRSCATNDPWMAWSIAKSSSISIRARHP